MRASCDRRWFHIPSKQRGRVSIQSEDAALEVFLGNVRSDGGVMLGTKGLCVSHRLSGGLMARAPILEFELYFNHDDRFLRIVVNDEIRNA